MAAQDTLERIMDAAERRIRETGYNGFSFRDIAADTGIKSASVHYHFPTKTALAVAVARRYAERFEEAVEAERMAGIAVAAAWRAVFRRALHHDGRMCLCGVLAAEADGLPAEVTAEARRFFERGVDSLSVGCAAELRAISADKAAEAALRMMATLEGAMLLARTLKDISVFDRATAALCETRQA